MGARQLIGAALRTGTSLKHSGTRVVPVDALYALAKAGERGSTLVHARLGLDNLAQLKRVVLQIAMEIFAARGWQVPERRYTAAQRMDFFAEQCWREYMGEPCGRCKGHGYIGRKLDLVRHHLKRCDRCNDQGFIMAPSSVEGWISVATRKPMLVRKLCPTCQGKKLVEVMEELKAKRLRPCPECWGSGSVASSVRARARVMRLGKSVVHETWTERFRAVLMTLRGIERDAMVVCREQLYYDN